MLSWHLLDLNLYLFYFIRTLACYKSFGVLCKCLCLDFLLCFCWGGDLAVFHTPLLTEWCRGETGWQSHHTMCKITSSILKMGNWPQRNTSPQYIILFVGTLTPSNLFLPNINQVPLEKMLADWSLPSPKHWWLSCCWQLHPPTSSYRGFDENEITHLKFSNPLHLNRHH